MCALRSPAAHRLSGRACVEHVMDHSPNSRCRINAEPAGPDNEHDEIWTRFYGSAVVELADRRHPAPELLRQGTGPANTDEGSAVHADVAGNAAILFGGIRPAADRAAGHGRSDHAR